MTHNASSLTSWVRAIKITLDQRGVDSAELFREAGLDATALDDSNARYSLASSTRLWELAGQATEDPAIGLAVARNVNQTTFHALGFAVLASPTLMDCFHRVLRYFRIVSDAAELAFDKHGHNYKFIIHPLKGRQQPAIEAVDAMMVVIMRMCQILYGPDFRARKVSLRRPEPVDTAPFKEAFPAPLEFDATETSIAIENTVLNAPLPSANRDLARHNDEILIRYLAHFDKNNTANQVHATLVEQLPHGEPSQENIAKSLHTSPRNLQRKLSGENTSYKKILDQTRRDLALDYIAASDYSISEITYLLGFSDTSSLTRAFKRWTGQSPTSYRTQHRPPA